MAARLQDRDDLKRALYRLINTDDNDDAMLEHDETALDGIYIALQDGFDDAQLFLIDAGMGDFWLTTSATISWTGSDPSRYWALPSTDTDGNDRRFFRMYGDHDVSALRKANGTRWGTEVPAEMRFRLRGNFYYVRNERIYLCRAAAPPSDLVMDYLYRIPDLADGTTVNFPEPDRALGVAFAALHCMEQEWFLGDEGMERKLLRNLERRKQQAIRRARRSLQPKMAAPGHMTGDHWFV